MMSRHQLKIITIYYLLLQVHVHISVRRVFPCCFHTCTNRTAYLCRKSQHNTGSECASLQEEEKERDRNSMRIISTRAATYLCFVKAAKSSLSITTVRVCMHGSKIATDFIGVGKPWKRNKETPRKKYPRPLISQDSRSLQTPKESSSALSTVVQY